MLFNITGSQRKGKIEAHQFSTLIAFLIVTTPRIMGTPFTHLPPPPHATPSHLAIHTGKNRPPAGQDTIAGLTIAHAKLGHRARRKIFLILNQQSMLMTRCQPLSWQTVPGHFFREYHALPLSLRIVRSLSAWFRSFSSDRIKTASEDFFSRSVLEYFVAMKKAIALVSLVFLVVTVDALRFRNTGTAAVNLASLISKVASATTKAPKFVPTTTLAPKADHDITKAQLQAILRWNFRTKQTGESGGRPGAKQAAGSSTPLLLPTHSIDLQKK